MRWEYEAATPKGFLYFSFGTEKPNLKKRVEHRGGAAGHEEHKVFCSMASHGAYAMYDRTILRNQ